MFQPLTFPLKQHGWHRIDRNAKEGLFSYRALCFTSLDVQQMMGDGELACPVVNGKEFLQCSLFHCVCLPKIRIIIPAPLTKQMEDLAECRALPPHRNNRCEQRHCLYPFMHFNMGSLLAFYTSCPKSIRSHNSDCGKLFLYTLVKSDHSPFSQWQDRKVLTQAQNETSQSRPPLMLKWTWQLGSS